jgi:hypothetical protein
MALWAFTLLILKPTTKFPPKKKTLFPHIQRYTPYIHTHVYTYRYLGSICPGGSRVGAPTQVTSTYAIERAKKNPGAVPSLRFYYSVVESASGQHSLLRWRNAHNTTHSVALLSSLSFSPLRIRISLVKKVASNKAHHFKPQNKFCFR